MRYICGGGYNYVDFIYVVQEGCQEDGGFSLPSLANLRISLKSHDSGLGLPAYVIQPSIFRSDVSSALHVIALSLYNRPMVVLFG